MELNNEAWDRWFAYRKAIKKPIRPASEEGAKLKLMRYGDDQAAVVDQSIAQGWQGLFAVTPDKPDPLAPKKRTKGQQEADDATFEYLTRQSEREWEKAIKEPLGKIRLSAALLARYDSAADQSSTVLREKRSALKDRVAELLREADAQSVLDDFECTRLVLQLFNSPGLNRLRHRAEQGRAQ